AAVLNRDEVHGFQLAQAWNEGLIDIAIAQCELRCACCRIALGRVGQSCTNIGGHQFFSGVELVKVFEAEGLCASAGLHLGREHFDKLECLQGLKKGHEFWNGL